MATTKERIEKIINKIDEINISKKLNQDEIQELLGDIDKDLIELKKSAEENHKKIIEERVAELRGKIDESLDNEDGWGKVKVLLKNNIKSSLEELKNEIAESEKVFTAIPVIVEHKPEDNLIHREIETKKSFSQPTEISSDVFELYQGKINALQSQLQEKEKDLAELAKWRILFPKQSPEQATEDLKKLASLVDEERQKHKEELGEIKKSLEIAQASSSSEEIVKISQDIGKMADKYVSDIGQKALPVIGPLVGAGFGFAHGAIEAGIYAADKFSDKGLVVVNKGMDIGVRGFEKLTEDGKDVYKVTLENGKEVLVEAGTGLKEFTENMAKLGVDFGEKGIENVFNSLENWRKGWENVAEKAMDNVKDVINENVKVAKEAVKGGLGAKWGGLELGINMGRGNVLEERVEGKDEKIKVLEKELETKEQELKRKDERIKELEQSQASQQLKKDEEQKRKDEDQKLLVTKAFDTIGKISRPNSPTPSEGRNDEEITRVREELEGRKKEFKMELDEKKQEIKELKEEIKELKQEIKELKNSQQTAQIEIKQ